MPKDMTFGDIDLCPGKGSRCGDAEHDAVPFVMGNFEAHELYKVDWFVEWDCCKLCGSTLPLSGERWDGTVPAYL